MSRQTKPPTYRLPDGRELLELEPGRGLVIDARRKTVEIVRVETVELEGEECTPSEQDQAR